MTGVFKEIGRTTLPLRTPVDVVAIQCDKCRVKSYATAKNWGGYTPCYKCQPDFYPDGMEMMFIVLAETIEKIEEMLGMKLHDMPRGGRGPEEIPTC